MEECIGQIMRRENVREALSRLRATLKEEGQKEAAKKLLGNGEAVLPLLEASDAKVRKNAAALLGDLSIPAAAQALFKAYQKEETLFVRGTLLGALEKTDPAPYGKELAERYRVLCAQEIKEEEKKHIRDELHALERILRREGRAPYHTFTGWNQRYTVLLTTDYKYAQVTADQITAYKKAIHPLGVQAVTDRLAELTEIRTFRELLFVIGLHEKLTIADGPEAFGTALAESKLLSLLERSHKEHAPFYFRIDIKAGLSLEERSRYTKRAAAVIEEKTGRKLLNAPDEYEFEIRMVLDKYEKIHVFLKMATVPMGRFFYRKETIAASIHPSRAALLFALAKPYLKKRAQILDPCCGVGTMLVERHRFLPVRESYGIDYFGEAIDKARINAEAAGLETHFIHRDFLDFTHSYPFDEIIANMPVRGKRTKEEQDDFYGRFFEKAQTLLAPGGIMLLYSNETGFIKKQLRLRPKWKLLEEYPIRPRDSFYLFILRLGGKPDGKTAG